MGETTDSKLNSVLMMIICGFVGIVLFVCLAPTMVDQIGSLSGVAATKYGPLLYVIPTVMIMAIIVGLVKFFTNSQSR